MTGAAFRFLVIVRANSLRARACGYHICVCLKRDFVTVILASGPRLRQDDLEIPRVKMRLLMGKSTINYCSRPLAVMQSFFDDIKMQCRRQSPIALYCGPARISFNG